MRIGRKTFCRLARRLKATGYPALRTPARNSLAFALFASAAALSHALAATFPVTDSISNALAQAQAGDTILVPGPGAFREHVVVAKSVRLLGTNAPVIDAGGLFDFARKTGMIQTQGSHSKVTEELAAKEPAED